MGRREQRVAPCCPAKPELARRPLLGNGQASDLEMIFKMLANRTRLRMLHALVRAGELWVSALAETLGMKPTAVSNQLQRFTDRGILDCRRNGNQILYRVVDPCVVKLLESAWCLSEDAQVRAPEREARERVTTRDRVTR